MSTELRRIGALAVLSIALTAVGCGGGSAESYRAHVDRRSGAIITGAVRSGGASIAREHQRRQPGVSVSVVGTNVRSGVDATGRFSLNGVPAAICSSSSGPGVDATLPVSQVQVSETISWS